MARQGGVEEVVDGLGKRTALFFILFKYNQQKGKYELGHEFKRVVICFVTSMRQKEILSLHKESHIRLSDSDMFKVCWLITAFD